MLDPKENPATGQVEGSENIYSKNKTKRIIAQAVKAFNAAFFAPRYSIAELVLMVMLAGFAIGVWGGV